MINSHPIATEKDPFRIRDIPWKLRQKASEAIKDGWQTIFGIPKSETPSSLPMNGFSGDDKYTWDDWNRDMNAKYPWRFFLGKELPIYFGRFSRVFFEEPYYWLRTHTIHRYHMVDMRAPQNGYHWGWKDRSEAVMFAAFAVLVDFVEKEYPGCVDWEYDEGHRKQRDEFMELYRWWKWGRKKEHDDFDKLSEELYADRCEKFPSKEELDVMGWWWRTFVYDILRPVGKPLGKRGSWDFTGKPDKESLWKKIQDDEQALEDRDDEMFRRLIAVRRILWT